MILLNALSCNFKFNTDCLFIKNIFVTEGPSDNSFARALSGKIQVECFHYLDALVMTISSEKIPAISLNSTLEETMIPSTEKVKVKIEELLTY